MSELLPEPPGTRGLPRWAHPELGWPISLAAGFIGTWIGLQTQVPGMAALSATLLFAPIHMLLVSRSRGALATLLGLGWALGLIAAVVGTTLEGHLEDVMGALPYADAFTRSELRIWVTGEGLSAGESRLGLFHSALALGLMVAASRFLAGIPALLAAALFLGMIAAGDAWLAQEAALRGQATMMAAALGLGPHRILQIAGFLFVWAALAEPTPVWPLHYLEEGRRRRLIGGCAAILVGLGVQAFFHGLWIRTIRDWLN